MFQGLGFRYGSAFVYCLTASKTASKTVAIKPHLFSLTSFGFYHKKRRQQKNEGNKKPKVTK